MLRFIIIESNPQYMLNLFQYISCYGLSRSNVCCTVKKSHFNTSHVTVYHSSGKTKDFATVNFNTSHVTVYPEHGNIPDSQLIISIHLMLRFILPLER